MNLFRKGLLALLFPIATSVAVGQTLVNFDDITPGTSLTHQLAAKGVHFDGSTVFDIDVAHSPHNALFSVPPNVEAFNFPGPMVITFDTDQSDVRMFAGTINSVPVSATLTAFNAAGTAVAHNGPITLPANAISTLMEVKLAQPGIRRVELLYSPDGLGNEVIDDLQFTGVPVTGTPPPAPTVHITSPTATLQIATPTFTVKGTVVGQSVDPHAVMTVHVPRPSGSSTIANSTYPITLTHTTGNNYTFSQVVQLGIGPQTITMDVQNTGGVHGIGKVIADAFPANIRARFNNDGGATTYGAFRFGSVTRFSDCAYAVYAFGAVAAVGSSTFAVQSPMFLKWLAVQDPENFPDLGCPKGEQRSVPGPGTAQDFVGGRIYHSTAGAFYVPTVFSSAIDKSGGEAGVGLPLADPTSDSNLVFLTWLFQQYRRPGVTLRTTMEIRGDPPRLYVERQGGDGSAFAGVLGPNNPTLVDSFACTTTAGPCPVPAPPNEPLFAGAAALCHNKEFNWAQQIIGFVANPDPPEWVPVHGQYVQTPVWGAMFDVHLAGGDNPFTHRNVFSPCPTPTVEALVNETICPSDWDLKIRPLQGYRSNQAVGRDAVQIEFERVDFQAQLVKYGDPTDGDMVFVSGRLNVDCGHGPQFKTEVHPPSVYTAVRTVTFRGFPATEADVWVNRFFPGGTNASDAVEFDINPPPRPSPEAVLGASLPNNQVGLVNVTITPIEPFGPVHVKVTATRGLPEVNKYGQMLPRTDDAPFGYDGRIHVFWSCSTGGC